MGYFVMACYGEEDLSAALGETPDLNQAPWYSGRPVNATFPTPLVYTVNPRRPGSLCALYAAEEYPLMRDDLIEALRAAGVDNLQLFPAVIRDPRTGLEHKNYQAFNIIGVVAAADMNKSVLMGISDSTMIDVNFERLALDEDKAAPFLLFRLGENVGTIIVSDVVRDEVQRRGIEGMNFLPPENYSG